MSLPRAILALRNPAGVGSYTAVFDHLAEVSGKQADAIVAHAAQVRANGH